MTKAVAEKNPPTRPTKPKTLNKPKSLAPSARDLLSFNQLVTSNSWLKETDWASREMALLRGRTCDAANDEYFEARIAA